MSFEADINRAAAVTACAVDPTNGWCAVHYTDWPCLAGPVAALIAEGRAEGRADLLGAMTAAWENGLTDTSGASTTPT